MADKKDKKEAPAAAAAEQKTPSIQIISQYVKDCSLENPHAPESLISGWPAPETHVQISLSQKQINENLFEAALSFRIEAKNAKDNKMAFIIDLHYGALVGLQNIPQENIPPFLAVEVPKLLFPFVREIVAGLTMKAGYPPLYLTPINFEALYMNEVKRLQEASKGKAGTA